MEQYFTAQVDKKKYFVVERYHRKDDGSKHVISLDMLSTENIKELVNGYEYVRQVGNMPILREKE